MKLRTAQKRHRCANCHESILKGEDYMRSDDAGFHGTHRMADKWCLVCWNLAVENKSELLDERAEYDA